MKIEFCWGTDLHLDFLKTDEQVRSWMKNAFSPPTEAVFLTGDTSLAPSLVKHLRMIKEFHPKSVYFVMGNHDFWGGSFEGLRRDVSDLSLISDGIVWLGSVDYVPFGSSYALVGHDGWYDALNGDYRTSKFVMNDWFRIEEFKGARYDLIENCRKFASPSADHIERSAEKAISEGRSKILVLTHFPPFVEACYYRGKKAESSALPWYSSRLMGDALLRLSDKHPEVDFTVLCGHTHFPADVRLRSNLRVVVGESEYGRPRVSTIGVEE